MANPLTTNRIESYSVKLLDIDDQVVEELKTTEGGTLSFDLNAEVKGGGKLTAYNRQDIKWLHHRVQPWFHLKGVGSWPLGVFTVTAPGTNVSSLNRYQELELHDKTILLVRDSVEKYYTISKNANVIDAIKSLLESAGQYRHNLTPSPQQLNESMVWEPNTTKLEIIETLLRYINYSSLTVDPYGVYQAKPNVDIHDRPITRTFQRGIDAIHSSDYLYDQDIFSVPNKVILIGEGSGSAEALVGTYSNTNPESDYSFEKLGYWNTYTQTGVEAESPSVINELARRKLIELSTPQVTIDIQHLVVPMMLSDIVQFTSTDLDLKAQVEGLNYTLEPGALCEATWREVVPV